MSIKLLKSLELPNEVTRTRGKKRGPTQRMNTKAKPSTYFYKLFRVKLADGRVTTFSLGRGLYQHACRSHHLVLTIEGHS